MNNLKDWVEELEGKKNNSSLFVENKVIIKAWS